MKRSILLPIALCFPLGLPAMDKAPTSKEEQAQLSPGAVLDDLMAGNARFVANALSPKDWQAQVKASAGGQFPKAVILSCLDSRVPVETVFDQGIGDVFVGRVAGNIEGKDQLGSMEFATKAAGAKLVMVLGHEACGAVKGAIDDVQMGNLTALLGEIKPAVQSAKAGSADASSKNPAFVDAVIRANVLQTVADIRSQSPVLAGLEKEGKIKIVGAYYSLQDGKVTLLDENR